MTYRGTYCAFHKHANSKVQKPPSQLRFSLPSIIITITSNEPWNTERHKTDRNPPITNHKPWPFKPVKVKFCFLRGPLRWLTAAKNAVVSWLLNFRIRMFVKSAVMNLTNPCPQQPNFHSVRKPRWNYFILPHLKLHCTKHEGLASFVLMKHWTTFLNILQNQKTIRLGC